MGLESYVPHIASAVGVLAFASAAVTFFWILVLRTSLVVRTRRESRLRKIWEPLLAMSTTGVSSELPVLRRKDTDFFLSLWNHYQQSLRGEPKEGLNGLARRLGLPEKAIEDIRSRNLEKN